jgi:hypothetical protein
VEFAATGGGPSSVGIRLSYLDPRVVDGAWCFYLRLWGVPESAMAERRDELARAALQEVRQSVAEFLSAPAATVVRPTQLHLFFDLREDGPTSRCSVEPIGPYSFSAGCWWASPSPV